MHNNHVCVPLPQLIPFTARQEHCRTRSQAISINFQGIHANSSGKVTENVITPRQQFNLDVMYKPGSQISRSPVKSLSCQQMRRR